MMIDAFSSALEERTAQVLDQCTRCGKCYEACPMPGPAGLAGVEPTAQVAGVLDLIRGSGGTPEAARWAQVCSGSGSCIPACPEGINPRFMLSLARLALRRRESAEERHAKGGADFAAMSRSVRVLSRIQLPPEVLARVQGESDSEETPEVVFYTGCNVLRTPHIVLICLDVLDALGVSYQVMGGPGDCCGVIQYRTADTRTSGRIAYRTTDRFAASGASRVLAWCPTCQVQLDENVLPGREQTVPSYSMEPFVVYLARRLPDLQRRFVHRVNRRVGLHEHPGVAGVSEAAASILKAVPGVDYVELRQPRVGYMCNTLQPLPEFKRNLHRELLEAAAAAGVDTLAGVYHACHRELCSHERDWPFEVVNFLEVVGESMGIHHEDRYKQLKKMQDVDAVLADVADLAERHRLKVDEVRAVIEKNLLAEQPLPLRG